MEHKTITAVDIDVSKGKSTVAVRRPNGEVVLMPFQAEHDAAGLSGLVRTLQNLDRDVRVVREHTGMYWRPIALALKEDGFLSAWSTPCSSTISAATLCARSKRTRRTP